jgi:hypothetical protein
MRFVRSTSILAGILLYAFTVAALAQERSGTDDRREAFTEWHDLAKGRKEFEISDSTLVPSRLALAAEQSGCRYKDSIKEMPLRFINVATRRLAIVFCFRTVSGSHQVFDFSDLQKPKLLEFPIGVYPEGFSTTSEPGAITWKSETGVFEAEIESDLCPTPNTRHTYQLTDFSRSFVLLRVEIQHPGCGVGEWATIWDAPQWSLLAKPKPP